MLCGRNSHSLQSVAVGYKPSPEGVGRDTGGTGKFVFIHCFVCHKCLFFVLIMGNCQEESCGEGMIPDMVKQAKTEGDGDGMERKGT